jgi:hypothetical protein
MTDKKRDKTPTPSNNEYHIHEDRRRRPKQRLLNAPYVESNNFGLFEKHGKVHQVQFKITPFAHKIGDEVAALFGMSLSQYCKALLYSNLGLVYEPIDRRRKNWRKSRARPRYF